MVIFRQILGGKCERGSMAIVKMGVVDVHGGLVEGNAERTHQSLSISHPALHWSDFVSCETVVKIDRSQFGDCQHIASKSQSIRVTSDSCRCYSLIFLAALLFNDQWAFTIRI